MKDGILSRWLYRQGCFITKDSNMEISHLCLDGGRLSIPSHMNEEFINEYSKSILSGEHIYICEYITPVIKMYCDFDFITDKSLTNSTDLFETIATYCNEVIEQYFGDMFDVIVCSSPEKEVQKNHKKQIKTGVHFIWPDLLLSVENAHSLSREFVKLLNMKIIGYNWSDIIDEQVYMNGLRMIGSRKVTNKKRLVKKREHSGESVASVQSVAMQEREYEIIKVDENRPYWPIFKIEDSKLIIIKKITEHTAEQISKFVNLCCIRTSNGEQSMDPINNLPVCDKIKKKTTTRKKKDFDADINQATFDRVETFIRYQTITQWNSPLRQLRKNNNFYIAKIDSMYCLNIQREHNSCGIYFQITEQGMYQRCFCRCETLEGRMDGYCSKYKSAPFVLPLEVRKMLFPKSSNRKITNTSSLEKIKPMKEIFGSNLLMKSKSTLDSYLNMSLRTIYEIEKICSK